MCHCDDDEEIYEITPKVLAVQPLIKRVYKFNGGGGGLHCLLDDGNYGCLPYDEEDHRRLLRELGVTSRAQIKAELACAEALRDMGEDEQEAALRLYHGEINEEGFVVA